MCLDTFLSIPSKDGPIVPKRNKARAKITGRLLSQRRQEKKKEEQKHGGTIRRGGDGQGDVSKSFLSKTTSHHHLRKVSR